MSGLTSSTKTVTLLSPHRHQGRDYPAGAALTLHADRADWLVGIGRAEHVPVETKKATKEQ